MIIISDRIITRTDRRELLDGAVVIRSGKIIAVGKCDHIKQRYPHHRIIKIENAALLAGLINVHAHLELPPLLVRIQADRYSRWVLNLLRAKKNLTRADYTAASKVNIGSLIASGTTTVADICTHGVSPAILNRSGLRAVIYEELISMDRKFRLPIVPRISRPASPLIQYGISPHSPHTVSETTLKSIQRAALTNGMSICMHVAETRDELSLLRGKASGLDDLYAAAGWDTAWAPRARSSFEYLQRTGILSPRFLAVHAVHIDDGDIAIIKRSGVVIAHCPRSNRALGVGKMRLAAFLEAGIPVGLGTDSLASSPSLNLWDEMRYACRIHRSSGITPAVILSLATLGGAKALGMDREIGSLEPGKKADIIAVPLPKKDTGDLPSDLLRETKSCIMSMVNGNIIYPPHSAKRK
jgi:cytosine/adenosine deaminase-related metal-dependent hydrolase